MQHDQQWNARYQQIQDTAPVGCEVLNQNLHLLPKVGCALDLACGLGGNSLLLAQAGLKVEAWDSAENALQQLNTFAKQFGVEQQITTSQRDVIESPPESETFDVIVVSYFLAEQLMPILIAALKPNGLIFYQTFCADKPETVGPKNPGFLLSENALLQHFSSLTLRVYREEGRLGDYEQGWRYKAMLVAEKR